MDQGIIPACADQHPMARFQVTALPSPKAEKSSRGSTGCAPKGPTVGRWPSDSWLQPLNFLIVLQTDKWIQMIRYDPVGGIPTPLKNDGVRQLGWWHSQYMGSHNPAMFQTTNQWSDMIRCFLLQTWYEQLQLSKVHDQSILQRQT